MENKIKIGIGFFTTISILAIQHANKKQKRITQNNYTVVNNSDKKVYFKPETTYGDFQNDGAYAIDAFKKVSYAFDGIATKLHNDMVYKVTNGIKVIVNSDGTVTPDYDTASYLEIVYFTFVGGWLSASPDFTWDKLFECAKKI